MDWPTVSILIVTWNRPKEIRRTLSGLLHNIRYPMDKLHWHLSDDQSPGTYLTDIVSEFPKLQFTSTVTERKGWGANVNKGITFCLDKGHDFIFLCEDDYVATRPIRLRAGVAVLLGEKEIGVIRYDGIEGHALDLELREAQTPIGKVPWLRILKGSPFLNVYSNRPHLMHRRFHDRYGLYPEGQRLAITETRFAQRVKRTAGPDIAVLKDGIGKAFDHIGKSRQGTDADVGKG